MSASPATRWLGQYFASDPEGYHNAELVVGFVRDLLDRLRGKVIVVRYCGCNHKGQRSESSSPGTSG